MFRSSPMSARMLVNTPIVESGPAAELFAAPNHPYTQALLAEVGKVEPGGEERFFVGTINRAWTSGTFGCVRSDGWQFHEGLDMSVAIGTPVRAPADGYITRKSVEPGNTRSPGQPLMALVSLGDIWVTANYKESQLTYVRPGQRVEFSVDAYPGHTFTGKVDSIMAGTGSAFSLFPPENATGNYVKIVQRIPVKITLKKGADPEHVLRVGMSVVPMVLAK